jgi:hypothetical protein
VKPLPFPPGSLVLLAACPHGLPGVVQSFERGRFAVRWIDLHITTRHKADKLIAASPTMTTDTGGEVHAQQQS